MTEIITIAISSIGIGFFEGWCSRMSDETTYDEKAEKIYHERIEAGYLQSKDLVLYVKPQFTRFHIGHPNDAWHWFRRAERMGGYAVSVASTAIIGLTWWLVPMVACHAIAGFIGFRWGSKWKQSFWLQKVADRWHRHIGGEQ